ncbi:BTB/POZ and MATH domain-containing protein 1-like [Panicum virgatum]|uniref:BTB/POZ and MATH domain-containing protein 1-like n=1 Tax=Panicum virgatum TaxID=38727 RepID=UPI0019D5F6D6|nr:BTB/POZ and MATH domain-containing protein 1-like [Panicum virgatum]
MPRRAGSARAAVRFTPIGLPAAATAHPEFAAAVADGVPWGYPVSAAGSSSAIVAAGASGSHVLRIEGYSRTKAAVPNGKYVESSPFRAAGHTWTIKYYPNGNNSRAAGCISLFLVLKDPVADHLMVQFWFSFLDQVDQQTPAYLGTIPPSKFKADDSWGHNDFIRSENLELSGYLKDDSFTVRCDMIVAGEIRTEGTGPSVVVPPSDCLQHLGALLLSGQGADVQFLVGGKTFSAHRCVLAARSRVFNAQLFGAMREGTAWEDSVIQIDDMAPQVFENLLHFVYTDSLLEMEGLGEAAAAAAMAQHLLEAADRYDMQRLKLVCEDRLCRHIDVSTVATTLALAEQHHCQGLKESCYEFLRSSKTLNEVMETDGFQHLVESCPSALLELMSKLAER